MDGLENGWSWWKEVEKGGSVEIPRIEIVGLRGNMIFWLVYGGQPICASTVVCRVNNESGQAGVGRGLIMP